MPYNKQLDAIALGYEKSAVLAERKAAEFASRIEMLLTEPEQRNADIWQSGFDESTLDKHDADFEGFIQTPLSELLQVPPDTRTIIWHITYALIIACSRVQAAIELDILASCLDMSGAQVDAIGGPIKASRIDAREIARQGIGNERWAMAKDAAKNG